MLKSINSIKDLESFSETHGFENTIQLLKKERLAMHPDKNHGEFDNEESKKRYHFLDQAIQNPNLFNNTNSQLVPMSEVTTIIESVTKLMARRDEPTSKEIEKSSKETIRMDLSRKYKSTKIGSVTFVALTGYLITQSGSLAKNPMFSKYFVDGGVGEIILIMLCVISTALFSLLWVRENRDESKAAYLLSEAPLSYIYEHLKEMSESNEVSAGDVREIVMRRFYNHFHSPLSIILSGRPCASVIDQVVEVQVKRLVERGVLVLLDKPGIERIYKLNA
jgi:hypothetical protein